MEKTEGIELISSYHSLEQQEELYKGLRIIVNDKGEREIICTTAVTIKLSKKYSYLKAGFCTTLIYEE